MEDFIPVYPSNDDPDIQRLITAKKEFNELYPIKGEKIPEGERKLYRHQELFGRLSTTSNRLLNIHETGTGKTCAVIAMAEKYKHKGTFKKCIIVERSDTLITTVREMIRTRCASEGEYSIVEEDVDGEAPTERALRKRRKESLKSWYDFTTYDTFTSTLFDMTDDQIRSVYDKHIFILDEAHNIRTEKDKPVDSKRYTQFQRLCFNIPQSKICLVTATPMINDSTELIYLMNLLQDRDNQIPIKKYYRLSELEPYFRGKISFIKASLENICIEYPGTRFEFGQSTCDLHPTDPSKDSQKTTNTVVPINMYLTKMGDLQVNTYGNITSSTFKSDDNNYSSMVFPIINGKQTEAEDYFSESGGKLSWKNNPDFLKWGHRGKYISLQEWIYNNGDFSNLRRLSGKFADIIEREITSQGCSFIFHLRVSKAGVKILTLLFELFGLEQFAENSAEFIFSNISKTKIKDSFKKKPRIALLTNSAFGKENRQEAIIQLFNSDANVNGEYIKTIIGSGKTRDGISIYNCQRMHLVSPDWTYAGMIQAMNRVLRVGGHNALKKHKITEAKALGYSEGSDIYKEYTNISVKIYRHAIDYNMDRNVRNIDTDNSDYYFMKLAVEKEIHIRKLMDMAKMCAMDAIINKETNVLNLDDPFNFDKIKYLPSWTEIVDPTYVPYVSDPIDYSTYNILYINSSKIVEGIKKVLLTSGSIGYDSIYDRFRDSTREAIFAAIESFRSEGRYIENSLGEKMTLEVSENGIHLQRFSYPTDPRFIHDISIYDFPQVVSAKRSIGNFLQSKTPFMIRNNMVDLIKDSDISSKDFNIKTYTSKMIKYISSKDKWTQMMILEELFYVKFNRSTTDIFLDPNIYNALIGIFKGYIFDFTDQDPPAWVHVITTTVDQASYYNPLSKHKDPKQVKIFIPSEDLMGWRLPLVSECSKYRKLIKDRIDEDMSAFSKYKIFGTILQDGIFRYIDDGTYEKDKLISTTEDKSEDSRMKQRGKVPMSVTKNILIKIAIDEGLVPPCKSKNVKSDSIAYLRESIKAEQSQKYVDSLSDDNVVLYHKWEGCSNVAKFFQIEFIKKMKSDGRLYEPYILTYNTIETPK